MEYVFDDKALIVGWLTGPLGDILSGSSKLFTDRNAGVEQLKSGAQRLGIYIAADIGGFVYGNTVGKYKGFMYAYNNDYVSKANEIREFILPVIIPNMGYYGGANYGISQQYKKNGIIPTINPFLKVETRIEFGSYWHDIYLESTLSTMTHSQAHLEWIKKVWTSDKVEPGPIGQVYRFIGTPAFLLFALVDR